MASRVGITTDPEYRRREWEKKHPDLWQWTILGRHPTKSEAQAHENQMARELPSITSPNDSGAEEATWYVYYFQY